MRPSRKKRLRAWIDKTRIEAGCDEVGRGCLSGPVYAAAVILPKSFRHKKLRDSKMLRPEERAELSKIIKAKALSWNIASLNASEIDKINILQASFKAMHLAISGLRVKPEHLLIDGNRFTPYPGLCHTCIIKGDDKLLPIAAASVLAKHARDEYMKKLSFWYPQYDWLHNKGYPTPKHRKAIHQHGISPFHRKTYGICNEKNTLLKSYVQE